MKTKTKLFSLLFIIFFVFHVISTFLVYPPKVFISPEPIYTDDYPYHYYHYLLFKEIFTQYHQFWAYNPHFYAGAPEPLSEDLANKFCQVFTLIFSFLSPIYAFKAFALVIFIFSPFLLYLAARNLELSYGESLMCFILGLLYWWGSPVKGMIIFGMYSFVLGLFLSLYLFSLVYKWMKKDKKMRSRIEKIEREIRLSKMIN